MAELDQYKENIAANLVSLEDTINRSAFFNSDRAKWKKQIGKQLSQIRNEILLLEEGIKDLPDSQAPNYVGSVKSFKVKVQRLEHEVDKRERGESSLGYQKAPIIQTPEQKRENARQELFTKGDQAQDTTMNAVKEMKKIAETGTEMAYQINIELAGQIEQLDRMNQKTEDTRSTLKKAQKNILYFMKALECDKCMVGLLTLILLALVAVVVLAIKKAQ